MPTEEIRKHDAIADCGDALRERNLVEFGTGNMATASAMRQAENETRRFAMPGNRG